jgi:hypothetical protein
VFATRCSAKSLEGSSRTVPFNVTVPYTVVDVIDWSASSGAPARAFKTLASTCASGIADGFVCARLELPFKSRPAAKIAAIENLEKELPWYILSSGTYSATARSRHENIL